MDDETYARKTLVSIEPPDILILRPVGPLSPEDLTALAAQQQQLAQVAGYTFVLADLSRMTGLPAETRKAAPAYARRHGSRAIAMFGASYHVTVLLSLVLRAIEALNKMKRPIRFFHSEAEARAWLDELRRHGIVNQ